MATSVSNVYLHVVEDVINSLRPDFQSEGVDDSVLNEVQALWELKMMQNGALQGPIDRTTNSALRGSNVLITPVHDLNVPYEATEEYETPTAEMLFPPTPLQTPMQTPLPGVVEPVVYQYFPPGPRESGVFPDQGMDGDVKIGRPSPYMQQPAGWMSQKPLGVDVNIAYEEGREEDETGTTQMPVTKDFFTLSTGKRKRDDHTSNYLPGGYIPQQDGAGDFSLESSQSNRVMCQAGFVNERISRKHTCERSRTQERNVSDSVIAAIVKSKYSSLKIPQIDGVNDNLDNVSVWKEFHRTLFTASFPLWVLLLGRSAEGNTFCWSANSWKVVAYGNSNNYFFICFHTKTVEDYNEPTEQEHQILNNTATPKATQDEEPPLNEEDDMDDLDDLDQADEDPKTDNLVLAQFEKVTRTKNRWKCILKDGIMHLNHKDHLFSKATGEFEF